MGGDKPGVDQLDIMMPFRDHHDMRTTLTLEEDVTRKLREEMRRSGHSFKQTVNDVLRAGLNVRRQAARTGRFRVEARALGQRPGLNFDNVGELLEQLEGPAHR